MIKNLLFGSKMTKSYLTIYLFLSYFGWQNFFKGSSRYFSVKNIMKKWVVLGIHERERIKREEDASKSVHN